ncbi:MAG: chorismate synthase [Flavobacteriales bacterium]|nr:chorismate synthase [Flavobacteriales bacterium]|tara:strand:- start:1923 stop:3008 length:1086 start_codon:yes stop_codon:yes gene_type:complete
MSSSIGHLFKLTTFGESHGPAVGGIIDGCPSGLKLNVVKIQQFLNRRKPSASFISTDRDEDDQVEFLSGIIDGVTLGTPIGFLIKNKDARSSDYNNLKDVFRPSHADFTYEKKYGLRDYRGGGRSSARETVNWVVGGAIASQILLQKGITVTSYVSSVGHIDVGADYLDVDSDLIYSNVIRCPISEKANEMEQLIKSCKANGDTVGGCISTVIKGVPFGLGEPVFHKLQSAIASSILNINTCKGVEFGLGFDYSRKRGSEGNDLFCVKSGVVGTTTNHSGGIVGGISNGQDICFRSAFKPVSSLFMEQRSINNKLKDVTIKPSGRHDACVLPRAVPIVDAMTAMIILDYYLLNKTTKISDL